MANGYLLLDKSGKRIADYLVHRWSVIIGLVIIAVFSAAVYFLAPKGENQLYVSRQWKVEPETDLMADYGDRVS